MNFPPPFRFDPKLDLVLDRVIDVPRELVWEAWTTPDHLKHWFCPKPWSIARCEIDLRPGGLFHTTMRSPDGQEFPNDGCYLEIIPNERLVFTDALGPGFRPKAEPFMTAALFLEAQGRSTRYTALAMHNDEQNRIKHEEMGFADGWSTVLDQLVEYTKRMQ